MKSTAVNNFVQIKAEAKKGGFQAMDENLLTGTIISIGNGSENKEIKAGDKILFSIVKHFQFPIDGQNYYWVQDTAIVHKF